MTPGLILAAIVFIFAIFTVLRTVRIIPQAHTGIVERLGKYSRTLEPGLHILIPFLDRLKPLIDMREQVINFTPQPVITRDNATIHIDTVFYYSITDPFRVTYEVANFILASEQLTITTLRNLIGSLSLEEALTSRDKINADLRIVLDEATEKWGIRVTRIEVKSIDPPRNIQEAMEKQLRADRDKRAAILTAEGEKQAAILRAEGRKESSILEAEGDQRSKIIRAGGERDAQILEAEGQAQATALIFGALHAGGLDERILAYKQIEAMPKIANGNAMKMLMVPSDAVKNMGTLAGLGSAFGSGHDFAGAGDAGTYKAPTGGQGRASSAGESERAENAHKQAQHTAAKVAQAAQGAVEAGTNTVESFTESVQQAGEEWKEMTTAERAKLVMQETEEYYRKRRERGETN